MSHVGNPKAIVPRARDRARICPVGERQATRTRWGPNLVPACVPLVSIPCNHFPSRLRACSSTLVQRRRSATKGGEFDWKKHLGRVRSTARSRASSFLRDGLRFRERSPRVLRAIRRRVAPGSSRRQSASPESDRPNSDRRHSRRARGFVGETPKGRDGATSAVEAPEKESHGRWQSLSSKSSKSLKHPAISSQLFSIVLLMSCYCPYSFA